MFYSSQRQQRVPPRQQTVKLGISDTFALLWPYFCGNLLEQARSIWFIITYLVVFQVWILELPVSYAGMIGLGIGVVALGLMFFMEGLRLGLMPLAETIGAVLPRNSSLPLILLFAFLLGLGATFAEPALSALQQAGSTIAPQQAPLLYSLLVDFPLQLVLAVGIGVGLAVLVGILRFFFGWTLKSILLPTVSVLIVLTLFAAQDPLLAPVVGLAWDCGGITTGPVTVPLVLALGIGVCRIVGDGETAHAGFGIVTLASLTPVFAVLLLGVGHYAAGDYYGQPGYAGNRLQSNGRSAADAAPPATLAARALAEEPFSAEEFRRFLATGDIDEHYRLRFEGGERALVEGRIVLHGSDILLEKRPAKHSRLIAPQVWNPAENAWRRVAEAVRDAGRAIVPLCLFLFLTLKLVLRERLRNHSEVMIGIGFALLGMSLFVLGITLGLSPLGAQLGGNIPRLFAAIGDGGAGVAPLFATPVYGKLAAIGFGFFLGYGATLAEPALLALGNSVEKITVGAFRRGLLIQSAAIGVGLGAAAGVCMLVYQLPLIGLLVPPYITVLLLTWASREEFVNISWDAAGVTTGPVSVPLILATGLGIGSHVPGVGNGFGMLALASLGPILTVLLVGQIVARTSLERVEPRPRTAPR